MIRRSIPHKKMKCTAESPAIKSCGLANQQKPPLCRRLRFSNAVHVLLVPSTEDFTKQEIESSWITHNESFENEEKLVETTVLMRNKLKVTSSSILSLDDRSEGMTIRGLEHLLHPMGAMRQKRNRQLLVSSIVERQCKAASDQRVTSSDELAMISQMLSRDAADHARAKGIEYERVERKAHGSIQPLPNCFDSMEKEEEELFPRTVYASSVSSPNLVP